MANGVRVFSTDDGRWFGDNGAAKAHAHKVANELKIEVRVSVVNIIINRVSIIELLDTGKPVIRKRQILFIAKPLHTPSQQKVLA